MRDPECTVGGKLEDSQGRGTFARLLWTRARPWSALKFQTLDLCFVVADVEFKSMLIVVEAQEALANKH